MAHISGLGIQNGLPQQIRRERAADIGAVPVILHLAARSNHADRIGLAVQQAQFIEEGQVFLPYRQHHLGVAHDPDAPEDRFSFGVFSGAVQIIHSQRRAAQLRDHRTHLQQQRKSIVPGRDGGAVGVFQIAVKRQEICPVPLLAVQHDNAAVCHNGGIHDVHPVLFIPADQIIAMQQLADIQITGIVSP